MEVHFKSLHFHFILFHLIAVLCTSQPPFLLLKMWQKLVTRIYLKSFIVKKNNNKINNKAKNGT